MPACAMSCATPFVAMSQWPRETTKVQLCGEATAATARRQGWLFAQEHGGTSGAQRAISAWSASGAGDEPEAQLYALDLVSTCRAGDLA